MDHTMVPHTPSPYCTMTELDVECIHQMTAFVDIDSTLLHRLTADSF